MSSASSARAAALLVALLLCFWGCSLQPPFLLTHNLQTAKAVCDSEAARKAILLITVDFRVCLVVRDRHGSQEEEADQALVLVSRYQLDDLIPSYECFLAIYGATRCLLVLYFAVATRMHITIAGTATESSTTKKS